MPSDNPRRPAPLALGGAEPPDPVKAAAARLPALTPATYRREPGVSQRAVDESRAAPPAGALEAYSIPKPPPGVIGSGGLAMDYNPGVSDLYRFATAGGSPYSEGLGFLGYSYLAELSQRPEYRTPVEVIAKYMVKRWIKISGLEQKQIEELEAAVARFQIPRLFQRMAELGSGFFGRSHLFIDTGETGADLESVLLANPKKVQPGSIKGFRVVEPLWTYPGQFNSNKPLEPDFYVPPFWWVMGEKVDKSRLLTFVGKEVPNILKPAYSFGGVSLAQLIKPYVDNWLRTRQSVSDITHSFTVWNLSTNMAGALTGGGSEMINRRADLFNNGRDNKGLMITDKETETFANVSAQLGTLDKLQAQAQEQIAGFAQIPLIILFKITPSGLNSTSEGEISTFHAWINSEQEDFFRDHLQFILELLMLNEWGEIPEGMRFNFNDLGDVDGVAEATIRKTEADTDAVLIDKGVADPEEVRARWNGADGGPYHGLLEGPPPEPAVEPDDIEAEEDPDSEDPSADPS